MSIYAKSLYVTVIIIWIFFLAGPFVLFFHIPEEGEPSLSVTRIIMMILVFIAWGALAFYIMFQFKSKNDYIKLLQHKLIESKQKNDQNH